jgi:hypothetical protein
LTLDVDKREAKVTWNAVDPLVNLYHIELYHNQRGEIFEEGIVYGTSVSLELPRWLYDNNLIEGTYTARVSAAWVDEYYAPSNPVTSAGVTYESLFAENPRFGYLSSIVDNTNTISGYAVAINLTRIGKPGVTYKVERAAVDALGNTGPYTTVTLSKKQDADEAVNLTSDILGNMISTVYDRTLPPSAGSYKYQIKATKGTDSQTREINSFSINPREFIRGKISVDAKTTNGSNSVFKVTPSLDYKNALQTDDKLVLYYVSSNTDGDIFQNGPYTTAKSIIFTKTELEANPIVGKNITVPAADSYVYVQAYLEYADGRKKNIGNDGPYFWNYNEYDYSYTGGIESINSYGEYNSYIYYVKLNQDSEKN